MDHNHEEEGTIRYSHSPFHSWDGGDIDESVEDVSIPRIARTGLGYFPAIVELAFLRAASRRFFLFLFLNLWCLRLDLSGTRKRSVNWV